MKDAYYLQLGDLSNFPDPIEEPIKTDSDDDNKSYEKHTEDYIPDKPSQNLNADSEFMPATEIKHRELDAEEFANFYDPNIQYNAQVIKHGVIHYPEHWDIYFCPRGRFQKFSAPDIDISGLLHYYLMDGASILPVLALDIQKDEEVGDLCASPGGKSLAMLFALRFSKLVCNDVSLSRVNKLKTVLNSYLPGTEEWSKKILVSNLDVRDWRCFDAFDKILLDVPCTNDRLSVLKDTNNIFAPKRYNERMQIPKIQVSMLCAALQSLKVGGSLVYSTCSLSPIQNDGVVHMSLAKLSVESPREFVVKDLSDAFSPLRTMFQFSDACQYGQLVVPFLPLNYGPMYICKISRNK